MRLASIFENNQRWIEEKLAENPRYFEDLARGQNPQILYIGCSDSRVTAEELMGASPGEVFVHRNIANVVLSTDSSVNAVVQYAVEFLKVKNIIVCGHYQCGGVKAAMRPKDMGQLNSWLQGLRDVYRIHAKTLNAIEDEDKRYDRLVELNVYEQCLNIMKIDHVQKELSRTGFPLIHGWVFDVKDGRLKDLGFTIKEELSKIFKIYPIAGSSDA